MKTIIPISKPTKKNKLYFKFPKTFLLVIAFSFSMSSCCVILISAAAAKGKAKKELTVENGAIPADFGKHNATMLVVKSGKKSYDKYLVKNFQSYSGKYLIVNHQEIESDNYTSKEKYRYIFDFTFEGRSIEYSNGTSQGFNVRRFSIYDRVTDKLYESKMTSSFFSKMMKAYIENLNMKIN